MRFKPTIAATLAFIAALAPLGAQAQTINPAGANAWTIYAFANGNVLYNLLGAAKGLVASPGYWTLIMLVALMTILPLGWAAANNHSKAKNVLGMFLGLMVFTLVGVKTTANAVIVDTVTGYTNVVKDAPLLVVLPESIVSTFGHGISELIEKYYSTPNSLQVAHGGGFDLANSLVQASTKIQITSPLARSTLAAFARNCIIPGIASARLSSYSLVTSTQLWGTKGTLRNVPQSPLTPVYTKTNPYGAILPCGPKGVPGTQLVSATYAGVGYKNAYDYLSAYFKGEAPAWLAASAGTYAGTATFSWLKGTLASAQSFLFGANLTQPTGETIEQAAAINSLRPALNAAAVASGQSQALVALSVTQGEKSQVSSWATSAIIFRDLSGYLYSVLQAFVMALLPIIMVALFIPGAGHRIAMTTMQVLFWLALWEPTLSIVDYIVDLYSQGTLGPTMSTGGGGYSMMNLGVISEQTSHLMLAAGFVASMVPLITWGLVKGGFAFTEFLTHGLGSAAAAQAGAMAATGNVSLGQESVDNRSIGQDMAMYKLSEGTGQNLSSTAGVSPTSALNTGAVTGLVAGTAISRMVSRSASQSASEADLVANKASHAGSVSATQAIGQGSKAMQAYQKSINEQISNSSGSAKTKLEAQRTSFDNKVAASMVTAVEHGAGVSQALGVGAKLGIDPGRLLHSLKSLGKKAAAGSGASAIISGLEGTLNQKLSADSSGKKSWNAAATASTDKTESTAAQVALSREMRDTLNAATAYSSSGDRSYTDTLQSAIKSATTASNDFSAAFSAKQDAGTARSIGGNLNFRTVAGAQRALRRLNGIDANLKGLFDHGVNGGSKVASRVQNALNNVKGLKGEAARVAHEVTAMTPGAEHRSNAGAHKATGNGGQNLRGELANRNASLNADVNKTIKRIGGEMAAGDKSLKATVAKTKFKAWLQMEAVKHGFNNVTSYVRHLGKLAPPDGTHNIGEKMLGSQAAGLVGQVTSSVAGAVVAKKMATRLAARGAGAATEGAEAVVEGAGAFAAEDAGLAATGIGAPVAIALAAGFLAYEVYEHEKGGSRGSGVT